MSTLVETRLPGPFNILQSSLQKDFARETDAVFPQLTNKTESTHQDAPSNGHESSSSTPTAFQQFQNAVTITVDRTYEVVTNFPAPQTLAPHEVLIRTKAVGLNHIDWKSVKYNYCLPASPWITGREMAGIVERIGCGVSHVEVGERVWTSTYYRDIRAGCFQELVVVPEHTVFRIPSTLDFSKAACLGVPAATAAMTLWRWLDVPMPAMTGTPASVSDKLSSAAAREFILIWGASTVTGQFCVQLAAHAGLEIIAVCSETTAALVKSLGASHVVTYTNKTSFHLIGEILSHAKGRLSRAIDAVGPATASLVLDIIEACGHDRTISFAPLGFMARNQVLPSNAKLKDVQMKQFILDPTASVYGERLNDLLEAHQLQPPKVKVLNGGVWAVEEGLEMLKKGNLAGEKLVVSFA